MLLTEPKLMSEALRDRRVRALLPTTLGFEELQRLRPEIFKRAVVSARVYETSVLNRLANVVKSLISPAGNFEGQQGHNLATARESIRHELRAAGYRPDQPGTITDLTSDQRLNLTIRTNADMARGFGQWKQGQDDELLDLWPAQELYRGEDRDEPRDWPAIWTAAATETDLTALEVYHRTGRFIALKDSPIWLAISDFGQPYPPFKFQSGMWVRDIDAPTARDLGFTWETIKTEDREFDEGFETSVEDIPDDMREQILADLGDDYEIADGVLRRRE